MRKDILILIIIAMLGIPNICQAGITKKEANRFEYHLKRIEQRNDNYRHRKEIDRGRIERYKAKKQAEKQRKKQLENVAKRNYKLAIERMKRDDANRFNNLRRGECVLSELTGNKVCK